MLKQILKTYGRYRPDELTAALHTLPPADLVGGVVTLYAAGELRPTTKAARRKAQTLCNNFYRYHEKNPRVAKWFLDAARLKQQRGERYGIGALTEDIRWDIEKGTIKTEGFKISNDVRACYARLVLMRDPSLCGLFALKPSGADDLLVVNGCPWSEFAKTHHAELWPKRKAKTTQRKQPESVGLDGRKARRK